MKRLTVSIITAYLLAAAVPGFCQSLSLAGYENVIIKVADHIIASWMTLIMLVAATAAIITATMGSYRGLFGPLGVILIASVLAAYAVVGIATWLIVGLVFAGLLLLIIEARALPGHGVFALAGVAAIAIGSYKMFGGNTDIMYSIVMSILSTLMSIIAFLVYVSRSSIWYNLSSRLDISVGYICPVSHIEDSCVDRKDTGAVTIQKLITGEDDQDMPVSVKEGTASYWEKGKEKDLAELKALLKSTQKKETTGKENEDNQQFIELE